MKLVVNDSSCMRKSTTSCIISGTADTDIAMRKTFFHTILRHNIVAKATIRNRDIAAYGKLTNSQEDAHYPRISYNQVTNQEKLQNLRMRDGDRVETNGPR